MHSGWIKLHRTAMDNEVFKNSKVWHLWTYILMSVSSRECSFAVRDGAVKLLAGQMIFGRVKAARDTGLSERNVRTALKCLISTNKVTSKATKRFTLLSVCNWEQYQETFSRGDQQSDQETDLQVTNSRPTGDHIQELREEENNTLSLSAGACVVREGEGEAVKKVSADTAALAIGFLNKALGKNFNTKTDRLARGWVQQWEQRGYTARDFKQVVERMVGLWLTDARMAASLRPSVLFGKKFEEYLNLPDAKPKEVENVLHITRKGDERTKYPRGISY